MTPEQSERVDAIVEQVINLVLDDPSVLLDSQDRFTVSIETRMQIRVILIDGIEKGKEETI